MDWAAANNYAPQNFDALSVYGHPTYFASSSDRVLTIHCTVYACSEIEGMEVHVPAGAIPTGGSDRHIAVVQPDGSRVIDLWQAETPPLFGVWNVSSGGGSRLDGDGLVADVNGDGVVGTAQATSARWSLAAGMVRAAELESRRIQHSLFATVECVNGRVWPALGHARQCSDIGLPMENAPRNGDWLWLDMTPAEIDALRYTDGEPLHPSMRVLLKGLAEYGTRIGDTGAYSLAEHENQFMYTASGLANPMQAVGDAEGWTLYNGRRHLRFRDLPAWIWTERLRVLDPCESRGTC